MLKYKGDNLITEYSGSYDTFKPNKGYDSVFTGYSMPSGQLGMSTDARTANVLQEINTKLNIGTKNLELSQVSPEVFESIPKGQLKEVNRLAKLTGTEVTLHAPVVEPSGLSQQGFEESMREATERSMKLAIDRANELNPDSSSPVTFHSSAQIPGSQWRPGKEGKEEYTMIAVNKDTGKLVPLKEEKRHYPGIEDLEKGEILNPHRELNSINNTEWINSLTEIETSKKNADDVMKDAFPPLAPLMEKIQKGEKIELDPSQKSALNKLQKADIFMHNVETGFNSLFNRAYKYSDKEQQEKLKEVSKEWTEKIEEIKKFGNEINVPFLKSELLDNAIQKVKEIAPPEVYAPVENFAIDKSAETFSNVAFHSYKKYKDNAPIVSIENPPYGGALSSGEDLKKLVDETRKRFVDKATKEGISKSEAQKQAERLIGVTWDVGHINMMRKQGFDSKEISKQSEEVAKLVKHVHLSDNFGMEHTELPMGMGNTPIKEIMEKLGKEGYDAKKVVEAMNWWQHFKTPPFAETLGAFGSPIYADGVGPYWNQTPGLYQDYYGGRGMFLPQTNYEMMGVGFSQLPPELGGQRPGAGGSRMSGRPME